MKIRRLYHQRPPARNVHSPSPEAQAARRKPAVRSGRGKEALAVQANPANKYQHVLAIAASY